MRHSISCPPLRQGRRIQRDCKRRRAFSTGWQHSVEKPRSPGGLVPFGSLEGVASAVPQGDAGSSTEGTSGTADLGLLRGRTGDAALGPGCVRASDTWRDGTPCLSQDRWRRVVAGSLAQARRPGVRELLPFAGVGLAWWDRHRCRTRRCGAWQYRSLPPMVSRFSRREVSERIGLG